MNLHSKKKSNLLDIIALLLFVLGSTFIVNYLLGERTTDYAISSKDFLTFVQSRKPVIIDLREFNEITKAPIPYRTVVHFPFLKLQQDMTRFQIDSTLHHLIVCSDGNRSRLIASFLSSRGIIVPYLHDGLWGIPTKQLNLLGDNIK